MFKSPTGYKGTVAHVSLFYLVARLNACELSEQAIHHICVILRAIGIERRSESKFCELRVGYIVQSEEVGTRLLYCRAIRAERVCRNARKKLAGTMTKTLVKVGVKVVAHIPPLVYHIACGVVDNKLLSEAITTGCLVVGMCKIAYSYALRTVAGTYPVGIRQIYTNSCRWILITTKHDSTHYVGCNTYNLRLTETRVDR